MGRAAAMIPLTRAAMIGAAFLSLAACAAAPRAGQHAVMSGAVAGGAAGATAGVSTHEGAVAHVAQRWRETLPHTPIHAVRVLPGIPGLYELTLGDGKSGNTKIVYGDAAGSYLIFGHVYDVHANKDLTQQQLDTLAAANRVPWSSLPLSHAVRVDAAPAGAPKVAILFNPDCGWCARMFHDAMATPGTRSAVDLRFMIFAPSPDRQAREVAGDIACHKGDTVALLKTVMTDPLWHTNLHKARIKYRNELHALPGCNAEQALASVADFASSHGWNATPVLISGDGRVHQGYLAPDALRNWLHQRPSAQEAKAQ